MSTKLDIQAHSEMLPLEATGLVGGSHVILVMPGNNDALSLRVKTGPGSLFPFVKSGSRVFVSIGIVSIAIAEVPDELPGLPSGFIKPGEFN